MKFTINSTCTTILASVSGVLLIACGGGQAGSATSAPAVAQSATTLTETGLVAGSQSISTTASETTTVSLLAGVTPDLSLDQASSVTKTPPPPVTPDLSLNQPSSPTKIPPADLITDVRFESTAAAGATQSDVPVTFGQVFAPGHVLVSNSLVGKLSDGTTIPLQMDVKATHPDGSVRHAVISAFLPVLATSETRIVTIGKKAALLPVPAALPASLLSAGFTSKVNLTLNNQVYSASADDLLKTTAYKTWLAGAIANEWIVSAPLKNAQGLAHPHLTARFAIRWYSAIKKARVDVTIENDWAYEAAPQNFTYDAQIIVGNQSVYEKTALTHFQHARWRKLFWWGEAPQVHIRHNTSYLINTRAVPNFDQSFTISEAKLSAMRTGWTGTRTEPMGVGAAEPYMPTTGGRGDIGLLPSWSAMYLLSMDKRAKDMMLGTADLAGSWSSHYRNKATDRPVSLKEFPYMTILGNPGDTYNPATGKQEFFPACATPTACQTPNVHDSSHQPNFAYLPYLVTGDYYYLEELQFWSMWNTFSSHPGYREAGKGLLKPDQVRGQGWSLRTLAEAAYITPDTDPLKSHFESLLSSNLDWYNTEYSNNAAANKLGAILNGYALVYDDGTGLGPWQDDFFTSAVGHAAELGYAQAKTLRDWKAKFSILRMVAPNACWIDGAQYSVKFRDSATSPFYTTMAQVYAASHTAEFTALPCGGAEMAASLKLRVGEMTGYSSEETGYPSNMQPALAYSADSGIKDGALAWGVFTRRSVKPDYGLGPQFAIIPR